MVWYPDDTDLEPRGRNFGVGSSWVHNYKLMVTIETIIYTILCYFITESTRVSRLISGPIILIYFLQNETPFSAPLFSSYVVLLPLEGPMWHIFNNLTSYIRYGAQRHAGFFQCCMFTHTPVWESEYPFYISPAQPYNWVKRLPWKYLHFDPPQPP